MVRYLALRISLALGVLWAAYTVAFMVVYLIPGDPVSAMAAGGMESGTVSEERLWQLREEYGFNDPLIVQYFNHLWAAITGDLGTSVQTGQPVTTAIGQVVGSTIQLASLALLISIIVGGGFALLATYTRITWLQDRKSTRLNSSHVAISYAVFCF